MPTAFARPILTSPRRLLGSWHGVPSQTGRRSDLRRLTSSPSTPQLGLGLGRPAPTQKSPWAAS
eukprot:12526643-Alexandrium_andersonii.AAC.1